MSGRFGEERKKWERRDELERPAREDRARKLRILKDIVTERFNAYVEFEQHYLSYLDEVSSFAVFHTDKAVRSAVKLFLKDAIPKVGLKIMWTGGDVLDVSLRKERASAPEKLEMLGEIE